MPASSRIRKRMTNRCPSGSHWNYWIQRTFGGVATKIHPTRRGGRSTNRSVSRVDAEGARSDWRHEYPCRGLQLDLGEADDFGKGQGVKVGLLASRRDEPKRTATIDHLVRMIESHIRKARIRRVDRA
jgi:hypothetical protein